MTRRRDRAQISGWPTYYPSKKNHHNRVLRNYNKPQRKATLFLKNNKRTTLAADAVHTVEPNKIIANLKISKTVQNMYYDVMILIFLIDMKNLI